MKPTYKLIHGILLSSLTALSLADSADTLTTSLATPTGISPFSFMLEGGAHILSGQFKWDAAADISGNEIPQVQSQHKYKKLSGIGSNLHSAVGYDFGQTSTVLFDIEIYNSSMNEGTLEQSNNIAGPNDTVIEASRISAEINKDDITSQQFALAYSSTIKVAPEIHYSWYLGHAEQEQNFVFSKGEQLASVDNSSKPLGPIAGLNSSYGSQWSGPWIGFEMWEKLGQHTVLFRYQHYEVDFEANGDWNLEENLQHPHSFEQEADGEGGTLRIEYQYSFSDYLSVGTVYNWNRWITDKGTYTIFEADGSSESVLLDKVSWEYYTISINLIYKI